MPIVNALNDPLTRAFHAEADIPLAFARLGWAWAPGQLPREAWRQWAIDTSAWLRSKGVQPRDAWVILPVGALLPQARLAWTQAVGGWLPRIDTIAGSVDSLGWTYMPPPWNGPLADAFAGPVTLDGVLDRLQARRSLGSQPWAKQWARRDPRGFDFAVSQVVDAAQTWLRALQACPPHQRLERVSTWRDALTEDESAAGQVPGGAGHREALLLAWALEWAAASAQQGFASDLVFAEAGIAGGVPAAWVTVNAGDTVSPGSEGALTLAALAHAASQGVPVLRVVASPVCADAGWRMSGQVAERVGEHGGEGATSAPDDVCVSLLACTDILDEARQAAAATLLAVNKVRQQRHAVHADVSANGCAVVSPVALIALDRGVVRHARALLEDAGVSLADETGWRLSTTRAASVISRLLAAANPRASTDELLDWLKSGWLRCDGLDGATLTGAVGLLEDWCRRHGLVSAWELGTLMGASAMGKSLPPAGAVVWQWASAAVAPLQAVWRDRQAQLSDWLAGLCEALGASGATASLQEDEAGQLAWEALRLDEFTPGAAAPGTTAPVGEASAWQTACHGTRMDGAAMQRWVREVLEDVTFRPAAPEEQADVVITTLARAVLRPFAALVMPGADERQLGALPSSSGWLGQRLRETMGLATSVQLRQAQWEALQLLLTQPQVTCLYRKAQGSESMEPSPWLARWAKTQAHGRKQQAQMDACHEASPEAQPVSPKDASPRPSGIVVLASDPRPLRSVLVKPVARPSPSLLGAPVGLPGRVSATTYEHLRQCPYRFFAATLLGLREAAELQEGLEASDYGTWLHEVLRRFHEARQKALAMSHADEDVAQWLAVANAVSADLGMQREGQRAHFLPYAAALPELAHAYVTWLRKHEAEGWSVRATEASISRDLRLADGSSLQLFGQLDRVDVRHEPATDGHPRHEVRWVLDYKTGSATNLSQRVKAANEDTQLAFYAALGAEDDRLDDVDGIRAGYVHLDPKAVKLLEHDHVAESAQALLQGLASDWQRLREGSPLWALGEGTVCGYCHARGLCRRDHWMEHPEGNQGEVLKGDLT